ncbi:MAG: N-acetylmuramoyl-L-alanine amidase [Bryobacteraceae bacterium]
MIQALAVCAAAAAAQTSGALPLGQLRSIRTWSSAEATRVVVELSRETKWKYGRLSNPERLYIDFLETRPRLGPKPAYAADIGDSRARRVRTAMKDPRTTRLVLDLAGDVEFELTHLTNPERLVIELRTRGGKPVAPAVPAAEPQPGRSVGRSLPPRSPGAASGDRDSPAAAVGPKPPTVQEARAELSRPSATAPAAASPQEKAVESAAGAAAAKGSVRSTAGAVPQPARPMRSGGRSMTRALGLRIGRVVLDPGHGGHDEGTRGPTGLLEKDLVLDVALRLGALIEERLGGEVVYTRKTDEYVGLEERTAIANEQRADLFLSIHANSSPLKRVSGAEVFFLNFTNSKEALDLAARENAGHNKSIFELRELLQKIALSDKLDESREFARMVQRELSREWRKLNPASRDRGVKMAPFVVLIGASMPSVLAEIGFLSNARDELLLKKPEARQRMAEALYRGIESYAASLGQTQALQAATAAPELHPAR